MNRPLLNITRLSGVERELHRLNKLIELLLKSQGIIASDGTPQTDGSGVTYVDEEAILTNEFLREIGKLPQETEETEEGSVG